MVKPGRVAYELDTTTFQGTGITENPIMPAFRRATKRFRLFCTHSGVLQKQHCKKKLTSRFIFLAKQHSHQHPSSSCTTLSTKTINANVPAPLDAAQQLINLPQPDMALMCAGATELAKLPNLLALQGDQIHQALGDIVQMDQNFTRRFDDMDNRLGRIERRLGDVENRLVL